MFDGSTMRGIREAVGAYAASFDPGLFSVADAQGIVEDAIAAENMLATVKALAARRVADTEAWRREGDLSAAHELARKSGTSVGKAKEALETAARISKLPRVEAAARRGELSASQAAPVADAATKDPRAEARLVDKAKHASLGELVNECARTKAAAEPDGAARRRAIHASRYLRRRRSADGAGELYYRSTLEEMAEIFAVVQGFAQRAFEKARAEGRREPEEAYLADGLLAAARAGAAAGRDGAGPRGQVPRPRGAEAGPEAPGAGGSSPDGADSKGGDKTGDPVVAGADAGDCGADEPSVAGPDAGDGGADGASVAGPDDKDAGADEHGGRAPVGGEAVHRATTLSDIQEAAAPPVPAPAWQRPVVPTKIVVRIDWDALIRGWPVDGEVCEISGVGPVSVSAVEAMMASGDAFLAAVVTKGKDVVNVAHLGRHPNARQRSGLEWLNPECTVLGCNTAVRLEIDHRVEWAKSKITLLGLLDGCCGHHHDLKTYDGWAFVAGSGKRPMVPPGDPRHPGNSRTGPGPPKEEEEEQEVA